METAKITDPFILLPDELSSKIASYFPPNKLFQLRQVSKTWQRILSDDIVEKKVVKRHGFDLTPGSSLQQKQRMCNHWLGRPTRMDEIRLVRGNQQFRLLDNYVAYIVNPPFWVNAGQSMIHVVNLETADHIAYPIPVRGWQPRLIFTDKLIGIATTDEVRYLFRGDRQLFRLAYPSGLHGHDIMTHGSMLAIARSQQDVITGFWTFDSVSKVQSDIILSTTFGPPVGEGAVFKGLICHEDTMVIFLGKFSGNVGMMKFARYTRAGKYLNGDEFKFIKPNNHIFEGRQIVVRPTGIEDKYCLAFWMGQLDWHLIVDLSQDRPKLRGGNRRMLVWKNRCYLDSNRTIGSRYSLFNVMKFDPWHVGVATLSLNDRLAEEYDCVSSGIAINDRFMIRLTDCKFQSGEEMQVFDYQGGTSLARVLGGVDTSCVGMKWSRNGEENHAKEDGEEYNDGTSNKEDNQLEDEEDEEDDEGGEKDDEESNDEKSEEEEHDDEDDETDHEGDEHVAKRDKDGDDDDDDAQEEDDDS